MTELLVVNVQKASDWLGFDTNDWLGFDTDTKITPELATKFYKSGYRFCLRYLSLSTPEQDSDLTREEIAGILQSGLALMAVQHAHGVGSWFPSDDSGAEDGNNAAQNAGAVCLPKGMNIWCDLENVPSETSLKSVIDYCNAWYNVVSCAGYIPGLYVGAHCGLNDSKQLFFDLKFAHYWKSMSNVQMIAYRGYQMIQHPTTCVHGVEIDPDNIQTDNYGGLPSMFRTIFKLNQQGITSF
jgi:hypothetical protein